MSTHISPHQQQFHEETTTNGHSTDINSSTYPPATATYNDVVQTANLFWEKLKDFHNFSGNKFKVPTIGGNTLDLHRLFSEVTSRGGIERVMRDRRWKEVVGAFRFPATITSGSFVLRKYYLSLLYHFEQVYYFQKQGPPVTLSDDTAKNFASGSTVAEESASKEQHSAESPELQVGSSLLGIIDGKFDNGYLVTMKMGSEELKGVLYHLPDTSNASPIAFTLDNHVHRHRKRSKLTPRGSKANKKGYTIFYAEQYAQLMPEYYGRERVMSKKIGELWNTLSESEKQVYESKGMED